MDEDAYILFFAIGSCHGLMKSHASEVRARPAVASVEHMVNLYNIDGGGFRLEESVYAQLLNGQGFCWWLELTLTLKDFRIEADVLRDHKDGQDVLVEIADCVYPTATECSKAFLGITQQLCSVNPFSAQFHETRE